MTGAGGESRYRATDGEDEEQEWRDDLNREKSKDEFDDAVATTDIQIPYEFAQLFSSPALSSFGLNLVPVACGAFRVS